VTRRLKWLRDYTTHSTECDSTRQMSYKCSRCKRDVQLDEYGGVRCPYCGHRVLLKERSADVKEVEVV
jgi:DNA-directed RNA polymerase, subunit P (EC 2.7.7.6)